MSDTLPNCPKCGSEYTYLDNSMFVCPECAHEWDENSNQSNDDDVLIIKDSNGTQLNEGDTVTLIKDLKVKGSSTVIKIGTKAKIYRLVDSDHDLDCKVDGHGQMMLKSEFVKKAN